MIITDKSNTLIPIACKYCNWTTYIEFDLVIHLGEVHHLGRGYLDTPPAPGLTSKSWSDDYRMAAAISEGKEMGARLDNKSIEKLDSEYSKYLDRKEKI